MKLYEELEKTNKLRQSTGVSADLSTHRESFSSCLKMKIQSVAFLTAVLILTTLVAESECFSPHAPGKREQQKKGFQAFAYQINASVFSYKCY